MLHTCRLLRTGWISPGQSGSFSTFFCFFLPTHAVTSELKVKMAPGWQWPDLKAVRLSVMSYDEHCLPFHRGAGQWQGNTVQEVADTLHQCCAPVHGRHHPYQDHHGRHCGWEVGHGVGAAEEGRSGTWGLWLYLLLAFVFIWLILSYFVVVVLAERSVMCFNVLLLGTVHHCLIQVLIQSQKQTVT